MHGEVPVLLSLSSLQPSWSSEQGAPGEIQPAAWCSASHSPSTHLPRSQNFRFSPLVRHGFHPGSLQQSPSWLLCVCQCPETITSSSWPARHQKNPRFGSSNAGGNHSASGSINPSGWGQLFEKKKGCSSVPSSNAFAESSLAVSPGFHGVGVGKQNVICFSRTYWFGEEIFACGLRYQ